ncbi:amino acid adenylation domain-containing protein [Streptomyces sp. NPDC058683]|uniref:non-ribosomal peptide synthetase n=1 Tax=Streptomyces sp. NPDC058683 TaxID=3346597 RepID=UPI003657EC42
MDAIPFSPQQRHIQASADDTHDAYGVIRIDGDLRPEDLHRALAALVHRHDLLRTQAPPHTPGQSADHLVPDGVGYQLHVVADPDEPHPTRPPGPGPALHAVLTAIDPRHHTLTLRLPALLADSGTLRILTSELARLRGPDDDEPPAVQYSGFAEWQNALLEEDDGRLDRQLERLRTLVRGQVLPFATSGEPTRAGRGARSVELSAARLARFEEAADRQGAELPDFLAASWQTLLWQHMRGSEVVLGQVTDGRVYEELETVVGPCTKVLPMVCPVAEADPFAEVMERGRRAARHAREELEFFNWKQDRGAPPAHPAWGFAFRDDHVAEAPDGLTFTLERMSVWTGPFTACLVAERGAGQLRITLEHRRGEIDDETAGCLLEQFVALADDAAVRPRAAVGALSAAGATPPSAGTAPQPDPQEREPVRCAHQLFERQAARAPERTALTFEDRSLSYGALNTRANRLARRLRELGVGPETLVGICLDRGEDLVIAMIAVHKAGAAYVPIDPLHPTERIGLVAAAAAPPVLVTDHAGATALPERDWHLVRTDQDGDAVTAHDASDLNLPVDPDQLAYVRHTSGSTGVPKGVQISHRALANFLRSMGRTPGISARDSLVAVTTASFDIAELELWLPLVTGARVTLAGRNTAADPQALARLLDTASATVLQATPVTWRMLLSHGWTGSPRLTALVGGEAVPPELAAALRPRVRQLWNMYGPTETTIWSTCGEIGSDATPVSVGRPIDHTCVHLLDADLRPVPVGMVGELCIGGDGLARGYADQPGRTADRFVPDPFGCRPGGRLYRTGDLARQDAHGRLYVLGRADSQVKIRGVRIELGEVETALGRHTDVRAAVARVSPEPSGELRLDAYVVLEPGRRPNVAQLRDHLRETLPTAMVPSRIGVLGELPVTAVGKIDRAALPEIHADAPAPGAGGTGLHSPLERAVAAVWQKELGLPAVGGADNFFDLGGHSVQLVQVAAVLSDELGRDVTPLTILEHPSVAALARHLDGPRRPEQAAEDPQDAAVGRDRLRRRRSRAEEEPA